MAFVNGTMPVLPILYIKITRQIIKWSSDHIKTPEMCNKKRPIMDFIRKKRHGPTDSEKTERRRAQWHTEEFISACDIETFF